MYKLSWRKATVLEQAPNCHPEPKRKEIGSGTNPGTIKALICLELEAAESEFHMDVKAAI